MVSFIARRACALASRALSTPVRSAFSSRIDAVASSTSSPGSDRRRWASSKTESDDAARGDILRGIPEHRESLVEEDSEPATEDDLARRRAAAVRHTLKQEMGTERASLTKLLAKHGVRIAGGVDEANALMDELLRWKSEGVVSGEGK